MAPWKTITSIQSIKNPWIEISKEKYQTPAGTIIDDYFIVAKKDYAVIVAIDCGKILFLDQYRPGIKQSVLNLPMGFIEPGEEPIEAAKRELKEETGYTAKNMKPFGKYALAPSFCTFYAHVFFTDDTEKSIHVDQDTNESDSRLVEVSIEDIPPLIRDGRLIDVSSILALSITGLYRSKLRQFRE